jgi:hypothetical protein
MYMSDSVTSPNPDELVSHFAEKAAHGFAGCVGITDRDGPSGAKGNDCRNCVESVVLTGPRFSP